MMGYLYTIFYDEDTDVLTVKDMKEMPASPREMLKLWDESTCSYKTNWESTPKENPLQRQEGGSHYKATKIQPIEVIWDWDLGFELGSALKYIQRHKKKGGTEDIKKAIHYLELYLENSNPKARPT